MQQTTNNTAALKPIVRLGCPSFGCPSLGCPSLGCPSLGCPSLVAGLVPLVWQVVTAFRSPWQNTYVKRLVGSVRWECLDHVIVLGERCLAKILRGYFAYYNDSRTHMALAGDSPVGRDSEPPSRGDVVAIPQVGGLHHRYTRAA